MEFFRKKQNIVNATWIIASAIILRSFIAPGYMVSVSDEGGLDLIFCDGPVSIKASGPEHSGHHHSTGHTEDSVIHISPTCSDWSTSGLMVLNDFYEIPVFFQNVTEETILNSFLIHESIESINLIRAPPGTSLI